MARGDLIKEMLSSYRIGDDLAFRSAASKVIDEERRKHHQLLADELQEILGGDPGVVAAASSTDAGLGPAPVSRLRPLPSTRDEQELIELYRPQRTLERQVLSAEASQCLLEVIDEQERAAALRAFGLSPTRTLLFVGPPGTGKSTSAEALAAELGMPLARIKLPSIVSSLLGETSKNLAAIFESIRLESWVVLFDEFDAIGRERDHALEHGELKRVVTSFLQLLDSHSGPSLIVAATNHPGMLDGAVWRRFDQVVGFDLPDQHTIERLLVRMLRRFDYSFSVQTAAKKLAGKSQADIELVCLAAMKRSVLRGDDVVSVEDVDSAMTRWRRAQTAIQRFRDSGQNPSP